MNTNYELHTKLTHSVPRVSDAELRKLYHEEKISTPVIGRRFGVSGCTIRSWMEKAGIMRNHPYIRTLRVSEPEIRQLYCNDGMTLAAIGMKFGVTRERVRQWMERDGIPRRHPVGNPPNSCFKIPRELWPEVCREYKAGDWQDMTKVARKWNVSRDVISRILRKSGIPQRQRYKIPIRSWGKVCQDYSRLGSLRKVAKLWSVTIGTIQHILVRRDVPRNPRGWSRGRSRKHKEIKQ